MDKMTIAFKTMVEDRAITDVDFFDRGVELEWTAMPSKKGSKFKRHPLQRSLNHFLLFVKHRKIKKIFRILNVQCQIL